MFWESVWGGLRAFAHWQTWVAFFEYMAICLIRAPDHFESDKTGRLVLLLKLTRPFQCLATIVFLWTLAPILFLHKNTAAWTFPWIFIVNNPFYATKTFMALAVTSLLLNFVPRIPNLRTLVLGGVALVFLVHLFSPIEFATKATQPLTITIMPSFWFIVGLLSASAVFVSLGIFAAAILMVIFKTEKTGLEWLISFPVGGLVGFIPVFIYADWLGQQVH